MRLSPLDIKKQEFTRTLRGYDQAEVQAFIDMLAGQWEALLAEQRRTEEKVHELKTKMEHYQKVEEALQETLLTARESSQQVLENARQEAAILVKKAIGESEDLTRDALRQRNQLLQEIQERVSRRDEIVARLRAFLTSETALLSRFEERPVEWLFDRAPEAPTLEAPQEARAEAVEEALVGTVASSEVSLETQERDEVLVALAEPEAVEEAPEIDLLKEPSVDRSAQGASRRPRLMPSFSHS